MKKKLFVLLLISALALFLLTSCQGLVPAEGEGEGEEEVITEGVTVDIEDAVQVEGKTYLSRGEHEITVTFPSPVAGIVKGYITYCTGDYSKVSSPNGDGTEVVFFPNEDKTIWTGSGSFRDSASWCCASYLKITSGECEAEVCINMPVIVDSAAPYIKFKTSFSDEDCLCGGCAFTISSLIEELPCAPDVECCGDECSGLDSWSVLMYEGYPYPWGECCSTDCEEPLYIYSGTSCPVEFTTPCLDLTVDKYYFILNMVDKVGNETTAAWGVYIIAEEEECTFGFTAWDIPEECGYDELRSCGFDTDGNPIHYIDPDWTMNESCANCGQSG